MSFQAGLYNAGTGGGGAGGSGPQSHYYAGRHYCNTTNNWTSTGTDGAHNSEAWNSNAGSGATPVPVWNDRGLGVFKAGTKLKEMTIWGYSNNSEVEEMEFALVALGSGIEEGAVYQASGDAAYGKIDILAPTVLVESGGLLGGGLADSTKVHGATISLGDYVMPEDKILILCARPAGTITSTRLFMSSITLITE